MIREGDQSNKSVLDDGASIYKKREEKSEKEQLKSLKGKEKWQFFCDYILKKLIVIIIIGALVASLIYTIAKPKPQVMLYSIITDSPFASETVEEMRNDMTERLVEPDMYAEVIIDDSYYITGGDYSVRMKMITVIAAAEVDSIILTKNELQQQANNQVTARLDEVLSAELLDKLSEYIVYVTPTITDIDHETPMVGEEGAYALDLSPYIESLGGVNPENGYVIAFTVNAPHKESIEEYVKYLFGIE